MEPPCDECLKTKRLIDRLHLLVSRLDVHDLRVHGSIDEFFYLTKIEELKFLLEQHQKELEVMRTTLKLMDSTYTQTYFQWRKDLRWLHGYSRGILQIKN